MRDKLTDYVELLFAGAADADEIREEILRNTLDKYDDLVGQGKSPEAAYRLAISGIGDVNEILGNPQASPGPITPAHVFDGSSEHAHKGPKMRAAAVAMYILCPVPLFILREIGSGVIGLSLMFLLIAAATALLILAPKDPERASKDDRDEVEEFRNINPDLKKRIDTLALVLYFAVSFITKAWHVTWLIFPIKSCVFHLINAIYDLKEERKHEN